MDDGIPIYSWMSMPQKMTHGVYFRRAGAVGNRTYRMRWDRDFLPAQWGLS